MPHSTSAIGTDIQDGGYEFPRIPLPRTRPNKTLRDCYEPPVGRTPPPATVPTKCVEHPRAGSSHPADGTRYVAQAKISPMAKAAITPLEAERSLIRRVFGGAPHRTAGMCLAFLHRPGSP